MHTHFTFRHMESSDAVRSHAEERLEKIQRYFADPIKISGTFGVERKRCSAQFDVVLRNGLQLHASETTENMYSSIDLALAKMERQVRRYKEKLKHRRKDPGESARMKFAVLTEEAPEVPTTSAGEPPAERPSTTRVVPGREMSVKPFSVDEAVMQLNLLHDTFLVFLNADTGELCVVYRRDEDTYGLIETGASVPPKAAATAT